jgi:hypothetical protein
MSDKAVLNLRSVVKDDESLKKECERLTNSRDKSLVQDVRE